MNENEKNFVAELREEEKDGKKTPKKEKKDDTQEVYAKKFRDGTRIEALYDATEEKTKLAISQGGKTSTAEKWKSEKDVFTAPSLPNGLLEGKTIKLPSALEDFENDEELFQEIKSFIHKYLEVSEEFENMASWYVMFTWVYDAFQEVPYLRAIGDYGTGKSRFLKTIGSLCYRPVFLNGSTSVSAVFRIIDMAKGTLAFDEADFSRSDTTSEIIKILNAGFQTETPVLRAEERKGKKGRMYDPQSYNVFGPKILATRKEFADAALESRCLTYSMQERTRKDIPSNLNEDFEEEALAIRNKLLAFRFYKFSQGISLQKLPDEIDIESRLRQIITPLYSVVEGEGKKKVLEFIQAKQKSCAEERFNSQEGEFLRSFLEVKKGEPEPTIKDIVEYYNENFAGKYSIKPRRAGVIIETFHFQKQRKSQGVVILNNEHNEEQIQRLKKQYGLLQPSMNNMNDVNITENPATLEDFQEIFGSDESTS